MGHLIAARNSLLGTRHIVPYWGRAAPTFEVRVRQSPSTTGKMKSFFRRKHDAIETATVFGLVSHRPNHADPRL